MNRIFARGFSQHQARCIVLGLLMPLHLLLLGWLACRYSPTSDEIAHLAAGVRIWETGKIDLYLVNPPLGKSVAALPVMFDHPLTDWHRFDPDPATRREWNVGQDYLYANGPRARWHFLLARWACLPFSLLGLWMCYRWGEAVFGPSAGVAAALQWGFSPNILGNGALITPDVAAAALGMTALFSFRAWCFSPDWHRAFLAGIWLGLAQLTKMTWVILYGLLPLLWLMLNCFPARRRAGGECRRRLDPSMSSWGSGELPLEGSHSASGFNVTFMTGCQLALILFLSLDLLNLGYGLQGTGQPLGNPEFSSRQLGGTGTATGNRFRNTVFATLPSPVPTPYLTGIDLQRRDFEGGWRPMPSYLRGEQRIGGWWYYYLYALLVKTPLGAWPLAAAALAAGPWKSVCSGVPAWKELTLLLLPALTLFVLVSSQTGFTRYFRYVLPAFPMLYVLFGSVFSRGVPQWLRTVGLLGLVLATVESLAAFPGSLAFFNVAVGGSEQGRWHLLDSNLDWGQDLYALQDWMRDHPEARPFHLAYAGVADPKLMGIDALPVPEASGGQPPQLKPGWYAVSVNHVHGYDQVSGPWTYFLQREAADRAGDTILIYRVGGDLP